MSACPACHNPYLFAMPSGPECASCGWPKYDGGIGRSGLRDVRAQLPRMPGGSAEGSIPASDRDQIRSLPGVVAFDPPPEQDASGPQLIIGDQGCEICRYKTADGNAADLTVVARVFPPREGAFQNPGGGASVSTTTDATQPFNTQAETTITLPATIQQSIEVLGYLRVGHQDCSLEIPFNMPLGQLIRAQTMGSAVSVFARLTTRYYPKLVSAGVVSWLVNAAGSNFDRNVAFDNPPPVSANITAAAMAALLPLQMQGFVGRGFTSPVPPQRIFFGWIDAAVAKNTQHLCPIPRGAQTVLLMADASTANNSAADPNFQGFGVTFNQVCLSPGGGTVRRTLNFPPNVTVPLRADCVAIEVCNTDAAPGQAFPFELQYDVGF
jgi:hypothetical protein